MKIDLRKPSNTVVVKENLYAYYVKTNMRYVMTFEWYCYYFQHFCLFMGWRESIDAASNYAFHTAIKPDIEKRINQVKRKNKNLR